MSNYQLPEGYKQTEVGVIPEGWDVDTFGKLYAEPSRNGIYKSAEYQGQGIRIVNMGEIFGLNFISDQEMNRILLTPREIAISGLRDGDLLFGRRSVVPAGAGKCSIVIAPTEPMTFESSIIRIRLKNLEAHPLFYYYFFSSPMGREVMSSIVSGTNIKGIRGTELQVLKTPQPSLPEQRSIAQALSDVDALIAALDKAIAKKQAIKTATMQQLLTGKKRLPGFGEGKGYQKTEVGMIPEDWNVFKFSDVTKLITCGIAATPQYVAEGQGYPFLSSSNVKFGKVIWSNFKYITKGLHKQLYKNNPPQKGDVLYSRVGTIGEAAVIEVDFEFSIYVSLTLIKPSQNLDSYFLMHLLNSQPYKQRANDQVYLGGGVGNLNVDVVRTYPIIRPPKEEQRAIATVLSDMDTEIVALETRLAKTQALKQGMMQALLTGRVRLV